MSNIETRVTAGVPTTATGPSPARAQAGELSLRISDLAVRHHHLRALTQDIAQLLLESLDLDVVASFACRPRERHRRQHRQQRALTLHNLAVVQRRQDDAYDAYDAYDVEARAKLVAYRAILEGAPVVRAIRAKSSEPATAIALPVGTPMPWAVLVVTFRPSSNGPDPRQEVLAQLATPLATATRAAHVLDEVATSEHQHSPRQAIIAASSEAILTIGEGYTIHEVNPAFTKVTGWTEHASVGHACSDIIRCRDDRKLVLCGTPACPLRAATSAESGTVARELSWQTRSGRLCDVSASFTVQRTGSDTRAIVVARDIATLHAANRMQANFISMVSHELRTPLNTINGFLEIVLDGQVGPLNDRQLEFLGYAHVSTQQLATLVEDILLISKADSGQFTLRTEAISPARVVTKAVQAVQQATEKAEVRVEIVVSESLPCVHADELRVEQVLTNLLGNAIKFTPSGGGVRVNAEVEASGMRFSVADTGKGVEPEDQTRIFERFYQSESTSRQRTSGYGLGLAIAKLIVEQHGGRIWVESQPGEGATFWFTLPIESDPI